MNQIKYIINVVIVALMLLTVAVSKDQRIFSYPIAQIAQSEASQPTKPVEELAADGTRVIHSATLAHDIVGYGGRTPISLYIRDGVIERVVADPNDETPSFFDELHKKGLFEQWHGMSLEKAAHTPIDAISGATYSSQAVIGNVQRAAAYAIEADSHTPTSGLLALLAAIPLDAKSIIAILVILSGVVITLVRPRRRIFVIVQQALNVAVLGFWCGSFISLSQLVSWASNGFNLSVTFISVLLLCVVIILPLLGRKGSYCYIHCPMGAAQELLGFIPLPKIKISPKVNKHLSKVRYYLLSTLLCIMWCGVGFEIINYEIFSAFLLSAASTTVQIMAVVFIALSMLIPKPYCRFVCPTGALLTTMGRTE